MFIVGEPHISVNWKTKTTY